MTFSLKPISHICLREGSEPENKKRCSSLKGVVFSSTRRKWRCVRFFLVPVLALLVLVLVLVLDLALFVLLVLLVLLIFLDFLVPLLRLLLLVIGVFLGSVLVGTLAKRHLGSL